jgi:hypothetical protein
VLVNFPGESEVVIELSTRQGPRRLRLGENFKVTRQDASLHAELDRLLGAAIIPGVAGAVEARGSGALEARGSGASGGSLVGPVAAGPA